MIGMLAYVIIISIIVLSVLIGFFISWNKREHWLDSYISKKKFLIECDKLLNKFANQKDNEVRSEFGICLGIIEVKKMIRTLQSEIEIIRCKDCIYGEQDEEDRWFCSDLGCQMGDIDGNGFCSDAERKD